MSKITYLYWLYLKRVIPLAIATAFLLGGVNYLQAIFALGFFEIIVIGAMIVIAVLLSLVILELSIMIKKIDQRRMSESSLFIASSHIDHARKIFDAHRARQRFDAHRTRKMTDRARKKFNTNHTEETPDHLERRSPDKEALPDALI